MDTVSPGMWTGTAPAGLDICANASAISLRSRDLPVAGAPEISTFRRVLSSAKTSSQAREKLVCPFIAICPTGCIVHVACNSNACIANGADATKNLASHPRIPLARSE
jgi:hypothetical protein